jgi:hypothetical protein
VGEDLALDVADLAARQGDGDVAAVVGARLARGEAGDAVAAGALPHGGQAGADADAFQRLDLARLLLHGEGLELHRLEAGGDLRLLFAEAVAGERLLQLLVLLFQRLDAVGQALHFRQHGLHVVAGAGGPASRKAASTSGDQIEAHVQ